MSTTQSVPFASIKPIDAINARQETKAAKDIDTLACSIATHGLILPLAVRRNGETYEIIDGRRRYRAIAHLVKQKLWERKAPVPVNVIDVDDDGALERSLAANIVRLPMEPLEQYEAFAALIERGQDPQSIAGRFGITVKQVRQQLALGKLAPVIRDAWRKGLLDEEVARVFTVADAKTQAKVFDQVRTSGRISAWQVRSIIIGERDTADEHDQEVIDAYLAKGGTITESLFDEAASVIDNPELLQQVIEEVEARHKEKLLADGWGWVEHRENLPADTWSWPKDNRDAVYTAEEQAELDALDKRLMDAADDDDEATIQGRIDAIEYAGILRSFTTEERKALGVIIDDHHTTYGVRRPAAGVNEIPDPDGDDDGAATSDAIDYDTTEGSDDVVTAGISNALMLSLTEQQTLAVARGLRECPDIALAALVASIACTGWASRPVKVSSSGLYPEIDMNVPSFADAMAAALKESESKALMAVAKFVAQALDLRAHNGTARRESEQALVDAVPGDIYAEHMRALFAAEDFFKRVNIDTTIAALEEMAEVIDVPDGLKRMKKSELLPIAVDAAKRTGWLPGPLRHADYSLMAEITA